jgi:hypothetical protein
MAKGLGASGTTAADGQLDRKNLEKIVKGQSSEAQGRLNESGAAVENNRLVQSIIEESKKDQLNKAGRNLNKAAMGSEGTIVETSQELSDREVTEATDQYADRLFAEQPAADPNLSEDLIDQTTVESGFVYNKVNDILGVANKSRERNRAWELHKSDRDKNESDQGFIARATRATRLIMDGFALPSVSPTNVDSDLKKKYDLEYAADQQQNYTPEVQRQLAADLKARDPNKGSIVTAAMASGAVEFNEKSRKFQPNANYVFGGLAIVEHAYADWSYLDQDIDAIVDGRGVTLTEKARQRMLDEMELGVDITKARGNFALGQKIHQEYQRNTGQEVTRLSQADATILGDLFKELYYEFNGIRNPAPKGTTGFTKEIQASTYENMLANRTLKFKANTVYGDNPENTREALEEAGAKRLQGLIPKLPIEEARRLAYFDSAAMVTRTEQADGQTIFTLTEAGKLKLGSAGAKKRRAASFSTEPIKPLTAPIDDVAMNEAMQETLRQSGGNMVGDLRNRTKRVLGKIKSLFVGRQLDKAMTNASNVAHAVDRRRLKIGVSMFITSALSDETLNTNASTAWKAEGIGIGKSKVIEYDTEQRLDEDANRKIDVEWKESIANYMEENPAATNEEIAEKFPAPVKSANPYTSLKIQLQQKTSLAQEVLAGVEGRNQANYLTYSSLGFNQRILPQQTYFNPTTSKFIRAVTRAVTPDMINTRLRERALRQMYAMHLVPGAGRKLEAAREAALEAHESVLLGYADRLNAAMTLDDATYDKLLEAIESKQALNEIDPALIEAAKSNLTLDPEADADLIEILMDQGQEVIPWIDGVLDFQRYYQAKMNNPSMKGKGTNDFRGIGLNYDKSRGHIFNTSFNFHIDGMTNGIASNSIQMGDLKVAQRTGVLRVNTQSLLDEGDVRDILVQTSMASLHDSGIEFKMEDETDKDKKDIASSHLTKIAGVVFGDKQLHKGTTMTYGYGKELESFWVNFMDAIELQYTANQFDILNAEAYGLTEEQIAELQSYQNAVDWVKGKQNDKDNFTSVKGDMVFSGLEAASKIINDKYKTHLIDVMSEDGITSRALMRGSAAMFAAMDEPMRIMGPTQILEFGKDVSHGYDAAQKDSYAMARPDLPSGRQTRKAAQYASSSTAAAYRMKGGVAVPGDWAWGGSLPGPIQALDAATVIRTFTGKSWNNIGNASGNNPYVYSIYDAFKGTAANYWSVLEEVNNNWVDASRDWSYIQATKDSLQKTITGWNKQINERIKQNPNEIVGKMESAYMLHVLRPDFNMAGELEHKNLKSLISSLYTRAGYDRTDPVKRKQAYDTVLNDFKNAMMKVGYNIHTVHKQSKGGVREDPSVNVRQLKAFVDTFYNMLGAEKAGTLENIDFLQRSQEMATKTKKQKDVLLSAIVNPDNKLKQDKLKNPNAQGPEGPEYGTGARLPNGKWIALQYAAP